MLGNEDTAPATPTRNPRTSRSSAGTAPPWTVYRALLDRDPDLHPGLLQVLSMLPFVRTTQDGRSSPTSLAELAAGQRCPVDALIGHLSHFEEVGVLRWNQQQQRVEFPLPPATAPLRRPGSTAARDAR